MAAPRVPHRYLYTYQPLKTPREFRLLRFRDFLHNELCELEIFDIDTAPEFSALSYTWGAPLSTLKSQEDYGPESTKILILETEAGHKQLSLLKNLYEGLCQLTKSGMPKYLWVDAICINQEDDQERCSQVTLMGAVYSFCKEVIVWLGQDESNLRDFMYLHEAFLPALWQYGEKYGQDLILKSNWTLDLIKDRLKLDTGKYWNSYAKFYDERRWFSRAWVLQELTLAHSVTILAGRSKLDWDEMSALANIMSMNGLGLLLQKSLPPSNRNSRQIMGFECLRLHTFRSLYHQLATPNAYTPASRSSTWQSIASTDSGTSIAESVVSVTVTDTVSIRKKGYKLAKSLRDSSTKNVQPIAKLFASSRSPKLHSWDSVKTWSSTLKSKFNYVYNSRAANSRADATGFSQWTTALIDNLIPNENPTDRWNTVFLCCCQWVRYFDATKLHDKIYGILGIIDMLRPPDVQSPIYPDYNKPVEEIYTSIAYYFIQNLPHLTILSCVQDKHSRKLKGLPSWVPDFASLSNEDLSFTATANWNASKAGTTQSYPRTFSGSTLELRGSCFDVVEDTVSIFVPPNWVGDGSHLPDGSVMSSHILGHFEKIIRFTCETKPWPYKRSRLEVLVATLVAGHLSSIPFKEGDGLPNEEDNSYFPTLDPTASPERKESLGSTGLGIDFKSLSPDWSSKTLHRRGKSESSPISPSSSRYLPNWGKSNSFSTSPDLVASPEQLGLSPDLTRSPMIRRHRYSLHSTEQFPYAKGIFQFRMWVLCMLIAGTFSEETEPFVDSCLGAISQLSYLCPQEIGHLPTRAEVAAASAAAKKNTEMKNMFQGIESATGVGDFASGQFSEFDVRWSKTQGTQKMFRTKKGYYGMGPISLDKGDQVWAICDARVPFVLRPSNGVEGAFELIGETYLHGCMHGEMMTQDQLESIGPVSLL